MFESSRVFGIYKFSNFLNYLAKKERFSPRNACSPIGALLNTSSTKYEVGILQLL